MSRIRLYVDEDSQSHRLMQALRARSIDLMTAFEAGMSERPDESHFLRIGVPRELAQPQLNVRSASSIRARSQVYYFAENLK